MKLFDISVFRKYIISVMFISQLHAKKVLYGKTNVGSYVFITDLQIWVWQDSYQRVILFFFAFVEPLKMWWNMMGMEIFNSSCSCSKEELYSYAKGNYFMPIFYNFAYHHFKGTIQVNGNSNLAFCCSLRWSTITYFD